VKWDCPNTKGIKTMDKILHHTVSIPCSIHHAFQLFTRNDHLESWLAVAAHVEPVVGGAYELFWNPSDRENNSTIGCRVTGISEDVFLSFEWKSPVQFKHFANNADPLTHVVVFITGKDGVANVHLIHSGWRSSPEWEEARLWQGKAWKSAFDQLLKIGSRS
jgi:uncharacterized protein YndB with AHSA1/START domain